MSVNLTSLTEAYVAAVVVEHLIDDDALEQMLLRIGADRKTARRVMFFTPLAFGYMHFNSRGVQLTGLYELMNDADEMVGQHRLADEPVFVESLLAAQRFRHKEVFSRVVPRSAVFKTIEQAVHDGMQFRELHIGATSVPQRDLDGLDENEERPSKRPSRPWQFWRRTPEAATLWETDATNRSVELTCESVRLTELIRIVFERYDVDIHDSDESAFRVQARVLTSHPMPSGNCVLQLDFVIRSPHLGERAICESVVGLSRNTLSALQDGVEKFMRSAMHPLLATLVAEDKGMGQVQWKTLSDELGDWRVCCGLVVMRNMPDPVPNFTGLIGRLQAAFMDSQPTRVYHWMVWSVVMGADGRVGCEVQIDNERWPEGKSILDRWELPTMGHSYVARNFCIFVPA